MQRMAFNRLLKPIAGCMRSGDAIWVHNRPEYASVLSRLLSGKSVRVVLHMHNSHLAHLNPEFRRLDSVIIVYCSRFLADEARGCGFSSPAYVLPNGADGDLFHPATGKLRTETEIAFAGRIVPEKGPHVLVEAMRSLSQDRVRAHCVLIGSSGFGTCRSSRYVRNLRASFPPNTEMAGYLSGEIYAHRLRRADIFCCPSVWPEPFGMVIVEAMASGLPIVASAVGGIPEVLKYGGGELIPPADPGILAQHLKALIQDPVRRRTLGNRAVRAVRENFSWNIIRKQYAELAREVCA